MNKETLEKLKPFLYGKLLGDASLCKTKKIEHNSRMEIVHSTKQKKYAEHCYKRLHNFSTKPFTKKSKLIYKGIISVHECFGFRTKALKVFTNLRNSWYKNNVKCLPEDLEEHFNAELLSYWYMDDGYIHCKRTNTSIVFCCENFSEKNIDYLIKLLKNKFNLESYKDKRNKSFRIRIGKKDSVERFKLIVKDFILDDLKYKIRDNPYLNR